MATGRHAFLVLGMHRSGTSALTRVLNLAGAALPTTLLDANFGNEAGYWEGAAFVALHDRWLSELGAAWDNPAALADGQPLNERLDPWARELAGVLEAQFGDAPLVVAKDPRMCLFLPVWLKALALVGRDPLPVLTLRHPSEVALSLQSRDGMPIAAGVLLWLQYMLAAERFTRGCRRVQVAFDDLLADAEEVLQRIERAFSVALPPRDTGVRAAITGFLRPQLRHQQTAALVGIAPALAQWVDTVYAWSASAPQGRLPGDTTTLDIVAATVAGYERVFAPALTWQHARAKQESDRDRARADDYAAHLRAELDNAKAEIESAAAHVRHVEHEFHKVRDEAERLRQERNADRAQGTA